MAQLESTPFGNSIFLWQTSRINSGNAQLTADQLQQANIDIALVKTTDGDLRYHVNGQPNVTPAYVRTLQDRGIKVMGWGYQRGVRPEQEGLIAAQQVLSLGLIGHAFDIEVDWERNWSTALRSMAVASLAIAKDRQFLPLKLVSQSAFEVQAAPVDKANRLLDSFQTTAPNAQTVFVGFDRWKSPTSGATWHNPAIHRAFLNRVNLGMPMAYWQGTDSVRALNTSLSQWRELHPTIPIVPAGRAYDGDGGTATRDSMLAFRNEAYAKRNTLNLAGVSWWSADMAIRNHPAKLWWQTLLAMGPWINELPQITFPEKMAQFFAWQAQQGYPGPIPTLDELREHLHTH